MLWTGSFYLLFFWGLDMFFNHKLLLFTMSGYIFSVSVFWDRLALLDELETEIIGWADVPWYNIFMNGNIAMVYKKTNLRQQEHDFTFWQTRSYEERIAALEEIRRE